jgi:hypothetical protein
MGQSSEFSQRAAQLRELGQQTRVAARRIGALVDLRWQSGAADRFRKGVDEQARAQLSFAETLEEVAAAFDHIDVVADASADVR